MIMIYPEPQRNSLLKYSFFGKYLAATVIKSSFSSCFISCVPLISGEKRIYTSIVQSIISFIMKTDLQSQNWTEWRKNAKEKKYACVNAIIDGNTYI